MAPSLVGTPVQINNSGDSGSQSITVPGTATGVIVCVGGYPTDAGADIFSGGSLTLNGVAFEVAADNDNSTAAHMAAMFWLGSPATGAQTFAWNWRGSGGLSNGAVIYIIFVQDSHSGAKADAIRSVYQNSQTTAAVFTSSTLTALSGDLIVAFCEMFDSGGQTFTWTNATKYNDLAAALSTLGSVASTAPSGNQTVTCTSSISTDGSLGVLVIQGPAQTPTFVPDYSQFPKEKMRR